MLMDWIIFATGAPPEGLSSWLWAAGWMAALLLLALKIWEIVSGRRRMPQPLMTERMEPLATRKELQKVEADLSGEIRGLSARIDRERATTEGIVTRIHDRIDRLAGTVGEMSGQLKVIGANVAMLVEQRGGRARSRAMEQGGDDE
jgi:uncharacterized protein YlxW (UPF0749 family)